jgi:excisionase family DNA binding protein
MSDDLEPLSLLSFAEASRILHISKRTLFRLIQEKKVPAFKVGRQWRIRGSEFRKWVEDKENLVSE